MLPTATIQRNYQPNPDEFVTNLMQIQKYRIEAELHYERNQLGVRIRDHGVGIDEEILDQAFRAGHWGLPGMRERAAKMGTGTEIELRVPAVAACASNSQRSVHRWFIGATRKS